MPLTHPLAGVYAAAVTPLTKTQQPDTEAIPELLVFLAQRGCHGALLLGTTGEGPSFSPSERKSIFEAAVRVRQEVPGFRLFAGTGTPSQDETIQLNKTAFDLGFDGVVVLPPFYYRSASEGGLFDWFSGVIQSSLPGDGVLLGYHFPKVSGVPLTLELLTRLRDAYPSQFAGVKDSSGDLAHTLSLAAQLPDQVILVGNDIHLSAGLGNGASGCITALANIASPWLRRIFDAHLHGQDASADQATIDAARDLLDEYPPFPASVKGLLQVMFAFPYWPVKAPLQSFALADMVRAAKSMQQIMFP